ncbi:MAG: helix-turn-helix domain-containing protein [Candidatus Gastranaerophilales bacterium]|nr:helix-turn-helix domain-containing protein [Candidatus Gastranaerophilales bacterium]MCM1073548.1 helix-turn-helix domain-containing protein [Bacteroides sp.]
MGRKSFKYSKILCKRVGKKIALLRREKQMIQDELSFNANISTSFLSAIERGKTDVTITTLEHLAKVLNVEITEFFVS